MKIFLSMFISVFDILIETYVHIYTCFICLFAYTVFPISTQGAKDVSNEDILIAEGTATLELAGRY
jgi:hypothetical protein